MIIVNFNLLQKLEEEPNLEIAQMIGLDSDEIDKSTITNNLIESDYNVVPQVMFRLLNCPNVNIPLYLTYHFTRI